MTKEVSSSGEPLRAVLCAPEIIAYCAAGWSAGGRVAMPGQMWDDGLGEMPEIRPGRKAAKAGPCQKPQPGRLPAREKAGLSPPPAGKLTADRQVLLQYRKAQSGAAPAVAASQRLVTGLREKGLSPATLRAYRSAVQGFRGGRRQKMVFPVRALQNLQSAGAEAAAKTPRAKRKSPRT